MTIVADLSTLDQIFDLSAAPNLPEALRHALQLTLSIFEAKAGSIMFEERYLRLGSFPPEALTRLEHWEAVIGTRLQEGDWQIPAGTALPISASRLNETMLLVNTPLLQASDVVGSLSLLFLAHSQLSNEQRQQLISLAKGLGKTIAQVAELDQADQRLRQLEVFFRVGQALMSTFDINKLLSDTMQLAADVVDAGAASLMLIDEERSELVFAVSHGSRGHVLRQQRIPLDEGIAGWVAQKGESVIVNDARTDPRFSHRVDVRTGFLTQSIAAVPLKTKGRIVGVLEVLNKYSGAGFVEEDLQLMRTIASQAAIAIENARLHQQVRQERDHIIQAQEEVRRDLNRKLHDGPVQLLSAISMSLDHLERLEEPEAIQAEMEELRKLVRQATIHSRNLLFELRPLALETKGLVEALEQYVEQLQNTESFTIHFKSVETVNCPPKVGGTIFAIVQEALTNIKRHARAQNVWLSVESRNDYLIVTIRDDGVGFNLEEVEADYSSRHSFGLLNMKERASWVDAELQIQSRPKRGTTIRFMIPFSAMEQAEE